MITKKTAYEKWLGIKDHHQPPSLYRLLGLDDLESDPDIISNAADSRMGFLRQFQIGDNSALSIEILNEIAHARVILLNAAKKAEYDTTLRQQQVKSPPKTAVLWAESVSDEVTNPCSPLSSVPLPIPEPLAGSPAMPGVDIASIVSGSITACPVRRIRKKKNGNRARWIAASAVALVTVGGVAFFFSGQGTSARSEHTTSMAEESLKKESKEHRQKLLTAQSAAIDAARPAILPVPDSTTKRLQEIGASTESGNNNRQLARLKGGGQLAEQFVGTYDVIAIHNKSNQTNKFVWSVHPDRSVFATDTRIGTWDVEGDRIHIQFSDTASGKAIIHSEGKDVFVGEQTHQNNETWICRLLRLFVAARGEHRWQGGHGDITLWSNGHINSPNNLATWERNGSKLLLHWGPTDTNNCTLSPDGNTYIERRGDTVGVDGNLTWTK